MNLLSLKIVPHFTRFFILVANLTFAFNARAWEVDFSRRQLEFNKVMNQERGPASMGETSQPKSMLDKVLDVVEPTQDIVILNTENGFVPASVQLRQNGQYKIHIVNLNPKNKNISFILDSFSEHHNTLFGQEKSFSVAPKTDGVFSFLCPETAAAGKFVVIPATDNRKPASTQ